MEGKPIEILPSRIPIYYVLKGNMENSLSEYEVIGTCIEEATKEVLNPAEDTIIMNISAFKKFTDTLNERTKVLNKLKELTDTSREQELYNTSDIVSLINKRENQLREIKVKIDEVLK